MKFGKVKIGKSDQHFLFGGTGSSSFVAKHGGRAGAKFDHLTYRPFKGAHRGYWYRLPWNKGKFDESADKKSEMAKKMKPTVYNFNK